MVWLRTLIFTLLVPCTWMVWVPYWLRSLGSARADIEFGLFRYFGVVAIVLGASIYLWCAWDFTFAGKGTPGLSGPKKLVVRGLYRFMRNPMYVGVLLVLVGEAFLFESRSLFELAGLALVIFNLVIFIYEEPRLQRKFGESYQEYCDTVPRWIPWLRRSKRR